jgi:rubredoxin
VVDVALSSEDAEGIALAHAELTEADVLCLHTEPDVEKGIPVYEVEFAVDLPDHFEHWEYEYTIHADTGIAPGTPFEDLSEDFEWPVCGLGKDAFEKEE